MKGRIGRERKEETRDIHKEGERGNVRTKKTDTHLTHMRTHLQEELVAVYFGVLVPQLNRQGSILVDFFVCAS